MVLLVVGLLLLLLLLLLPLLLLGVLLLLHLVFRPSARQQISAGRCIRLTVHVLLIACIER